MVRPAWQIWTIVGGVAVLAAVAGTVAIVAVAGRDGQDTTSTGPPGPVAAVEELRSHLPEDLKSADDCAETTPMAYATSTVTCTWPSSHVPHTATYSLFTDDTSMNQSALGLVRSSGGYGPSCTSAGDFDGDGGQMTWERDNRERGTVWCYLNRNDDPVLLWTDTAPRILGSAVGSGQEGASKLLDWFHTKGQASLEPVPSPPTLRPAPVSKPPTTATSSPRPRQGSPSVSPPISPPISPPTSPPASPPSQRQPSTAPSPGPPERNEPNEQSPIPDTEST